MFHLRIPHWTDDYRLAIASVGEYINNVHYSLSPPLPPPDPTQYCQEWSLEGGWVAEEGKFLLPPKVMERVNLMDCYHALLLTCLLKAGFFLSLVELVKTANEHISVMAAVLMGEILHMVSIGCMFYYLLK